MLQRFMLFALATAVLWAQNESRPVIQKTPVGRTSASSGKEMYWAYCAACHGTDGKGDGPASDHRLLPLQAGIWHWRPVAVPPTWLAGGALWGTPKVPPKFTQNPTFAPVSLVFATRGSYKPFGC